MPVLFTIRPHRHYPVNAWARTANGLWVHKYSIIGTSIIDYAVWEPHQSGYDERGAFHRTHSAITHHAGNCLGDVTTRTLPAEIDALPAFTEERLHAVRAWYAANKEEARAAVLEVYGADFDTPTE